MALTTFHHFPQLPKELRDEIWDMAIRPDRPAVHHFSTFKYQHKSQRSIMEKDALEVDMQNNVPILAAPQYDEDGNKYSWTKSNPSIYLHDSGLWTACWESRQTMERHFGTTADWRKKLLPYRTGVFRAACKWLEEVPEERKWRATRRLGASHDDEALIDVLRPRDERRITLHAPATGVFKSDAGETQLFTVRPMTDLFFLQPFDPDAAGWLADIHAIPLFSPKWGFDGVGHMAFEFDPSWSSTWIERVAEDIDRIHFDAMLLGAQGTFGYMLRALSVHFKRPRRVWFVDRRLRRRRGCVPLDMTGDRHVFYGNGCRYFEVRDDDEGWSRGCMMEKDGFGFYSVFYFLRMLDDAVDIYSLAWDMPSRGLARQLGNVYELHDERWISELRKLALPGVLACLEDSE